MNRPNGQGDSQSFWCDNPNSSRNTWGSEAEREEFAVSMQTDVIGRVRNTRLSARSGLMPLFEAVVNSIHSIQEARAGKGGGQITVRLQRDRQLTTDSTSGGSNPIETFVITDNGAGFTEANYKSFETMDSQRKIKQGGKGVGRLLWLKAFDEVEIESTYCEGSVWYVRRFAFKPTAKGIEKHKKEKWAGKETPLETRTVVKLKRFQETYQKATVKAADAIAHRIIEHCLEYYLLGAVPQILIEDPSNDQTIDLEQIFVDEVKPAANVRTVKVGEHTLSLHDVLIKGTSDTQHRLHYCAHNRVVESAALAGKVSHLDAALRDERGEAVFYHGYVIGPLLDDSVDAARAGFSLDRDGDLAFRGEPTWEDVAKATMAAVREYLLPKTEEARRQAFEKVQNFVEREEPKYRPLLNHRKAEVEELSGNLSPEKLDLELHRLYQDWRHDVRKDATQKLGQTPETAAGFAAFKADFTRIMGDLQEVAKADLSDYVVHRATVLSFFEKLLGTTEAGTFETEDTLHDFLFPQRATSDEIDLNDHNLWVLDERLVYHKYLASDLPFSKQKAPAQVKSNDRPDLLIYNSPMAFTPGEDAPFGSVVIVEFKRPQRGAYDEEENPIRQVIDYVDQIRDGKARRKDGAFIDKVPSNTPFYCYVVADLTDRLRKEIRQADFLPTPDQLGYFKFHTTANAYIEISGYRKVLTDAKKRNKAFFDQLQIRL